MGYNGTLKAKERIGKTHLNNYGSKMEIVEYKDVHNIWVKFDNGYVTKCQYTDFQRGDVANPYDKTVFNIGFIGEGIYKFERNKNKRDVVWRSMISRCYSEKIQLTKPRYLGCVVCEEWHNFQNFAKWFDKNYYEVDSETMDLDKDIIIKNNKIYSPSTCIFAPHRINSLFVKANKSRGNLPIGVHAKNGKYEISCSTNLIPFYNKKGMSKGYNTSEEAFNFYKQFKEQYIKDVADTYKNKIPNKLYKAMYEYKVEITD